MVKIIAPFVVGILCASCSLFEAEKEPEMVSFVFKNADNTVFQEIKVKAYSAENGQLIAYDSIYHHPLKSPSIPYNSSTEIAFLEPSFQYKQDGIFEAIVIKKDSTIFRAQIGEIKGTQTRRNFNLELSSKGITLK
jgi:hypothetical protein